MPVLENYSEFGGYYWHSGCIRNALAYQGYRAPHTGEPYSDALLFGVSGGAVFGYFHFHYKGYDPQINILTRNTVQDLAWKARGEDPPSYRREQERLARRSARRPITERREARNFWANAWHDAWESVRLVVEWLADSYERLLEMMAERIVRTASNGITAPDELLWAAVEEGREPAA